MQSVHTRILVYSGDVSLTTTAMTTTVPTSKKKIQLQKKFTVVICLKSENNILVKLLVLYHTYVVTLLGPL